MKQFLLTAIILLVSFFCFAADTTTVVLSAGQNIKSDSIKVIDQVTNNEITASITSVSIQNSNPEVAAVSYLSRVIKITRVKAGSGTASISCRVSYVDPGDGLQKTEDRTIIINYTVIGTPHGIKLSLTFN